MEYESFILNKYMGRNKPQSIKSPIDSEVIGQIATFDGRLEDYIQDIKAASELWKGKTLKERSYYLRRVKRALQKKAEELSLLLNKEIGKPLIEARTEVSESIDLINFYLQNSKSILLPKKIQIDEFWKTKDNYLYYEPCGIVGIIKPWNYPISNSLWSIVPALIAGNVVLYKPSEYSSLTGAYLGNLFIESGFPPGVFNLLIGDREIGKQIVDSEDVSVISFTGSTETARAIQKRATSKGIIRKYSFETGGSDCAIVDKDVNIGQAVDGILWGAFNNSGQVCTSIENVFLPKNSEKQFLEQLIDKATKLVINRDIGPIQNQRLRKKVGSFIRNYKAQPDCEILCGGELSGNYLLPTIIKFSNRAAINDELFCNILRVFSYDSLDDIISIINSSRYGLGCSIWTSVPSAKRIRSLTAKLNVGMIWINDVNIAFPQSPWTGRRDSGNGQNLGLDALLEFCNKKSVTIDKDNIEKKSWWFPYVNN